jgi:flagellar protein FlaG
MSVQLIQDSIASIVPATPKRAATTDHQAYAHSHAVEQQMSAEDIIETADVPRLSHRIVDPPAVNGIRESLQFDVDVRTGEKTLKIIDKETGKVVRQVPPEELLHTMQVLQNFKGLLVSKRL